MRIIITGSPGTGKSQISKLLAKELGIGLIDLKRIARERGLVGRGHEVDVRKLANALRPLLKGKESFVAEGHLACEIRLPADHIIVLRTNPSVLRRRLARRGYGKKKLEENLMAEMLDYCVQRAEASYGARPLELDTSSRSVRSCASEIIKAVRQNRSRLDSVDYSQELERHLGLRQKG